MTARDQCAILLSLADQLRNHGSWTGETHVQKATFLLQTLLGVPVGFDFVLYKHGPFSFELRDLLGQMEAERLFCLEEQPFPYGPKIVEGSAANIFRAFIPNADQYQREIDFIATQLGSASVSILERIATALFVALDPFVSAEARAQRLVDLKPHIRLTDAQDAFDRLQNIRDAAVEVGLVPVA